MTSFERTSHRSHYVDGPGLRITHTIPTLTVSQTKLLGYAAQQQDVHANTDADTDGAGFSERSQRSCRLGDSPDGENSAGEMQRGEDIRMKINVGLPSDTDLDRVLDAEMASTEDSSEDVSGGQKRPDESGGGEEARYVVPTDSSAIYHLVFYGCVRIFDGSFADLFASPVAVFK
ncbi:hypothetical protein PHLCEN_2v9021 [Hermanssonia centrifuga]|uniref:Uncharacterized protein n=1 Tax=Hermanssonia centrifuga TaxID=98765 RepID=A0A2R6NRZ5_9APHY|nr:hypothetical protein PHLCEN_2v9021 [Hermanssonia centrifuga]